MTVNLAGALDLDGQLRNGGITIGTTFGEPEMGTWRSGTSASWNDGLDPGELLPIASGEPAVVNCIFAARGDTEDVEGSSTRALASAARRGISRPSPSTTARRAR